MPTTFAEAIVRADVGLRFFARIEGIPCLFLSGAAPVGPSGSAWAAPTSGGHAVTLAAKTLDVSGGIVDVGPEISRVTAETSPGRMEVVLQDDAADTLLGLFARESSTGHVATLAADFGYDTGGGPTTMTVDSTTNFAATGYLYWGRETLYYGTKAATSFGSGGTPIERNLFDLASGGSSYGDSNYEHLQDSPGGFGVVTDYVRTWAGRWGSIWAHVVDADGRGYDTAFYGSASREIWRGVLRGVPKRRDDWHRWALDTVSIEGILSTEVGRDAVKGALMKLPGGQKENQAGHYEVNDSGEPLIGGVSQKGGAYYLDGNTRFVHLEIIEYTSAANYPGTPNADGAGTFAIGTTGVYTLHELRASFNANLETAMGTLGFANAEIFCGWSTTHARWIVQVNTQAGYVYDVRIRREPGSVLYLFGFEEDVHITPNGSNQQLPPAGSSLNAYVHPDSLHIPFFYTDTEGTQPDGGAGTGYAKIGGKEIVRYTSIVNPTTSSEVVGLFELEVAERGALGTGRVEHRVQVGPDWTSEAEEIEVLFGVGFDGTDPLTALLQLAVSTGEAAHHGTYDTLEGGVAAPLNPLHFDTQGFAAKASELPGAMQSLRYFASKSQRLSELAAHWLQPFGYYLAPVNLSDGTRVIGIREVLPPLESEEAGSFDSTSLRMDDPVVQVDGLDRVVNQLRVKWKYDLLKEEQTQDSVTVRDRNSEREHGVKGKLTWEIRGFALDPLTAQVMVLGWAFAAFARFGRPYDVLRLRTGRAGLVLESGDTISLTVVGFPSLSGGRGITGRPATVLSVRRTWLNRMGTADPTGAEVLCILEPDARHSTYAPSGKVASTDAGVPSITLSANVFTAAPDTDAAHFEAGDVIVVFQAGDATTRETHTVISRAGNVLTLNSALALVPGSSTYIVPADYSAGQASQREHAHVASTATPPVLTVSDTEAFVYV